jgi:hypothetical protein
VLLGILAATIFTLFMAGLSLIIVVPIIFFTIFMASSLCVLCLGSYYIIKRFDRTGPAPTPAYETNGHTVNPSQDHESWLAEFSEKQEGNPETGSRFKAEAVKQWMPRDEDVLLKQVNRVTKGLVNGTHDEGSASEQ